ncbi:MAG: S8 family serine peptidase [Pyrinomonadaceae bacterium]
MSDRIRVRLVPKNRIQTSVTAHASLMSFSNFDDVRPEPEFTRKALSAIDNLNFTAVETEQHGITGFVPKETFERTFSAKLVEVKITSDEIGERAVMTDTFLRPEQEIQIPQELADSIDFAYVPTPPLFFGLNPVPPQVSVYHLRVEDVARVLRAYRCHRQGWTGQGVRIAMADSGFAKHPFFEQYDFNITRISTPSATNPAEDTSGHGSGESANVLIIAPNCVFFGVKHDDYSAEALETSIAQNPKVITNSWGWNIDTTSKDSLQTSDPNLFNELTDVERILKDAINSGISIVFSAGNGHRAFPGSLPEVISVGGVSVSAEGDLSASSYASSFTSKLYPNRNVPDFCGIVGQAGTAPLKGHIMLPVPNDSQLDGDNMTPSQKGKGWGIFSGTSAAAPQIAGVIALMLSANPELTQSEIKAILAATATDIDTGTTAHGVAAATGVDLATGSGLVNALNACLRAKQVS